MTKKSQHVVNAFRSSSLGQSGAANHDDGKAELPRGFYLGERAAASRIAGDNPLDTARTYQIEIAGQCKGAARNNDAGLSQRQRFIGSIGQPQGVGVLRLCGERGEMLAANGEEYAGVLVGQSGGGSCHILNLDPVVGWRPSPRRPFECDQRGAGRGTGCDSIAPDLGCEGMRGIDEMGNALGSDVVGEPVRAAETADAGRQRLRCRGLSAASVGIDRVEPQARRRVCEPVGFAGSAQDEGAHHG